MKEFNKFSEALLLSVAPQSDAVGPVTGSECPCQKKNDMFSRGADEILKTLNPTGSEETIQPDDGIGEEGEIQSDSESSGSSGAEFECMGEAGLKIKFNEMELVLPRSVADDLKAWMGSDESSEAHEDSESPAEEEAEHDEGGSEENVEEPEEVEETEEPVTESKKSKKPPFWMKFKKGKKGKKADKEEATED